MLLGLLFIIIWVYVWFKLVASSFFITGNGIFYSGFLGFVVASVIVGIVGTLLKGLVKIFLIIAAILLIVFLIRKFFGKKNNSADSSTSKPEE